jgi:hypothetical protein
LEGGVSESFLLMLVAYLLEDVGQVELCITFQLVLGQFLRLRRKKGKDICT